MSKTQQNRIVDPVLTTIARGYKNAAFIGEKLFPTVLVDKEVGRIPLFGKDGFRVFATKRAPTANSNVRNIDGIHNLRYQLNEHDLMTPVDTRQEREAIFDVEQRAVAVNQSSIELELEVQAATLAQNASEYAAGNKVTLTGTDGFDHPESDPQSVVSDSIETLRAVIGLRPNVCIIGAQVFKSLKKNSKLKSSYIYRNGGVIGIEELKEQFQIDDVVVGEALYANGSTAAFGDVWGNNIILAYVAQQQSDIRNPYEPSFGYRLRVKGQPVVDRVDINPGKVFGIRNTDITDVVRTGVTNTGTETSPTWLIESAYLISNCVTGS